MSFNQILAECPRVPCVFFSTNLFSKSLKFYSLRPIHAESSDNSVPPTYRYHTVSLNLSSLCAAISVIYKIPEILIAFSMENCGLIYPRKVNWDLRSMMIFKVENSAGSGLPVAVGNSSLLCSYSKKSTK